MASHRTPSIRQEPLRRGDMCVLADWRWHTTAAGRKGNAAVGRRENPPRCAVVQLAAATSGTEEPAQSGKTPFGNPHFRTPNWSTNCTSRPVPLVMKSTVAGALGLRRAAMEPAGGGGTSFLALRFPFIIFQLQAGRRKVHAALHLSVPEQHAIVKGRIFGCHIRGSGLSQRCITARLGRRAHPPGEV